MDQMLYKLSESNTNRQSGEIYTIRTKISRRWLAIKKSSKEKKGQTGKGTIGLGERIRTNSLKVYESKHAEIKQNKKTE